MSDSENPYQSPQAMGEAIGINSGDRRDLRAVAVYQRNIQLCILAHLMIFGVRIVANVAFPSASGVAVIGVVLTLFWVLVLLAGLVLVFLLAMKVYHPATGVFLALLALVPCIGLLSLLTINSKATEVLRKNGFRVGLLGADLSQFP